MVTTERMVLEAELLASWAYATAKRADEMMVEERILLEILLFFVLIKGTL